MLMLRMFLYTWQAERCEKLLPAFQSEIARFSRRYDVVVRKFDNVAFKISLISASPLRASGYRFTMKMPNGAERTMIFIWTVEEEEEEDKNKKEKDQTGWCECVH